MATSAAKGQTFVWRGTDHKGRDSRGEIVSMSLAMARAQLRRQGIKPGRVRKKSKPLFGGGGKKIKARDIAIFVRQLATMVKAGIPLVQSFDIVGEGLENAGMRALVRDIRNELASGSSLALSLGKHPRYFDELFVNLIGSGEASGTLETMLDQVATYREKSEALKATIKKALSYPIAVVIVSLLVTGVLLVKVVPQFAGTFSSFGSELPAFTLLVLTISSAAREWWMLILIVPGGVVFAHRQIHKHSAVYREGQDRLLLRVPVVGNIIFNSVIARFSRTLATTFSAGVPLVEALDSVAGATGSIIYARAIRQIRDEVTTGASLHHAIDSTGLFPTMLLQMVSVGEESGTLDKMLEKVATFYEEAVDNAVDSLSSLLEPVIISVLGILVGGLMIAMYLPIFMLGSVL